MKQHEIERLLDGIDKAISAYRQGLGELTRDGQPIFAPDEAERRRKELRRELDRAWREAEEQLQAAAKEAEAELAKATPDPLLVLNAADLQRAAALREFIDGDAQRSQAAFMEQAALALERGDKAACAVSLRVARQLMADTRREQRFDPTLSALVSSLEGMFGDARKRAEISARLEAMQAAMMGLAGKKYMLDAYGPGAVRRPAA